MTLPGVGLGGGVEVGVTIGSDVEVGIGVNVDVGIGVSVGVGDRVAVGDGGRGVLVGVALGEGLKLKSIPLTVATAAPTPITRKNRP